MGEGGKWARGRQISPKHKPVLVVLLAILYVLKTNALLSKIMAKSAYTILGGLGGQNLGLGGSDWNRMKNALLVRQLQHSYHF